MGTEFECKFTGPDGDYVANVKVTKVEVRTSSSTSVKLVDS